MTEPLDLDAYLARIEWGAAARPDYDTLASLLGAHMARIPFENLDVLLGRPVRIDLEGLQRKLVAARRGGYCFEHATLLAAALERLGFRPVRHSARVTATLPRAEAPRTHMLLTVAVPEGTFVLDPGFGSLAPRVPVPLDGTPARVGQETHSIVRDGPFAVLRAQVGLKTVDAWASTLEQDHPADFEMGNHYTSTYPGSQFKSRLLMRALTPEGRVTVLNRDVTVWTGREPAVTTMETRGELRAALARHFGFDLPEVEALRLPAVPEWA